MDAGPPPVTSGIHRRTRRTALRADAGRDLAGCCAEPRRVMHLVGLGIHGTDGVGLWEMAYRGHARILGISCHRVLDCPARSRSGAGNR